GAQHDLDAVGGGLAHLALAVRVAQVGAGEDGHLHIGRNPGQILVGPAGGEVVGDGHAGGLQKGQVVLEIAAEVGVDQLVLTDVIQVCGGKVKAVLLGDAAFVGTQKYPVVALESDHGEAVFALKLAAAAVVDPQLPEQAAVVGSYLVAAVFAQV